MSTAHAPSDLKAAREQFTRELNQEHVEEASFLYLQRRAILSDPSSGWQVLQDLEQRLENHLLALEAAADLDPGDPRDPGEVYVNLRFCCRRQKLSDLGKILEPLGLGPVPPEQAPASGEEVDEQQEIASAVVDALTAEMPAAWGSRLAELPLTSSLPLQDTFWRICGYRRWSPDPKALPVPAQPSAGFCFHAGRTGNRSAFMLLNRALSDQSARVRSAAALAILRLGNRDFLRLMKPGSVEPWVTLPLGLGGDQAQAEALAETPVKALTREHLLALGLLGCPAAVTPLIQALADTPPKGAAKPGLAEPAAEALNLITGANLRENVFVPEEPEEDELLDEEKEKLKRGEPLHPPGQEPGRTVARLSRDPAAWKTWWLENQKRFDSRLRWRFGQPASPRVLVEHLAGPETPAPLRALLHEELVIRYGLDLPFEPDLPVARQLPLIEKINVWAVNPPRSFPPGGWVFAGSQPYRA